MDLSTTTKRCRKCGVELFEDGVCPACSLEQGILPKTLLTEALTALSFQNFGDYEFLEEIARGGMGVVYKAWQRSLNRIVAIKMILAGHLANQSDLRRFRAEAQTAAQLRHPNIVAIHEVGEHNGLPFFSMDYVEGYNLAQVVHDKPFPIKKSAAYVKTIAEAVHFAHSQGVLHRDLKPSNILIDENDQPRITDFGLAKRFNAPSDLPTQLSDLTLTGQVLGSPNFMPPEQAVSSKKNPGPSSDVYSIGAILYQLLTGRPPFLAETLSQTLRLLADTEPVSPKLLNPGIHRDLETVCLKCLEKEPTRRYGSAIELAREMDRFLKDEPIHARRASKAERLWRGCRRHPTVASLTGLVALLLVVVSVISTVSAGRLRQANREGQEKLRQSLLDHARVSRSISRPGRRFESLEAIRKAAAIHPSLELRNEAIACMALADLKPIKDWETLYSSINPTFVFDELGESYARVNTNGEVIVCSVTDAIEQHRVKNLEAPIDFLRFSPEGDCLSIAFGTKSNLKLYNLRRGTIDLELTNVSFSQFNPGNRKRTVLVAQKKSNNEEDLLSIYYLETGRQVSVFTNVGHIQAIKLSPDGDFLATIADPDKARVQIYAMTNAQLVKTLSHSSVLRSLDWRPGRNELAVGGEDGSIQVWDLSSAEPKRTTLSHGGVVTLLRYNHDGSLLASLGWNDVLRLWNPSTKNLLLSTPAIGYRNVEFSKNSTRLSYWPSRYKIRLCELATGKECHSISSSNPRESVRLRAFSKDDQLPALASRDNLLLWDEGADREIAAIPDAGARLITYDAPGKGIVTAGPNGLKRWPVSCYRSGDSARLEVGPAEAFGPLGDVTGMLRILKDERLVVMIGSTIYVVDLATHTELRHFDVESGPSYFSRSRYGHWLTFWKLNAETISIWDVDTGKQVIQLPAPLSFTMDFTPDNQILMTGSVDGYTAWHTDSWKPAYSIHRPDTGDAHGIISLSSEGNVGIVTYGRDSLRLFNQKTGVELATLIPPEPSEIQTFNFDSDRGKLYVTTAETGTHVWDLSLIRQELASLNLDWEAPPLPQAKISARPKKWEVVFLRNSKNQPP